MSKKAFRLMSRLLALAIASAVMVFGSFVFAQDDEAAEEEMEMVSLTVLSPMANCPSSKFH